MLLSASVERDTDEFFGQSYEQLLAEYRWLQRTLPQALPDAATRAYLDGVTLHVILDGGREIHFSLLRGPLPAPRPPSIRMPYALFRRLLFIDFGQFLTVEEFLAQLEREANEHGTMAGLDVLLLKSVAAVWFDLSYRAAELFFASEQNLRDYFYNSQAVLRWWHEGKLQQRPHFTYTKLLCEVIDPAQKTLLDIGCGLGRFRRLYDRAGTAILADISLPMLQHARAASNNPRWFFCQADSNHAPFARGIDIIIAMQMMMHIAEPFKLLQKLAPILEEDGVIWTDFTCSSRLTAGFRQESFFTRLYSAEHVLEQCCRHGFDVEFTMEFPERHKNHWLAVKLRPRRR